MFPFPSFWRARRAALELARSDAAALVAQHGRHAYGIAREMARAERSGKLISPGLPRGHWSRVRVELRRAEQAS